MAGVPATEIRFFSYRSRIGRLRYFAYGMGTALLLLPAVLAGGILYALQAHLLAFLLFGAAYVFMITMSFVFAVRRLHDMDASGWWCLIIAAVMLSTMANALRLIPANLFWLPALLVLADLVLVLMLLFRRGTAGDNRYGPQPPPNSGWVVAGAWSTLIVPFFGGVAAAIAIPAYQDYIARSQMSEGIQLAGQAEVPVAEFFQKTKTWPTDISSLYSGRPREAVGRYVATISVSSSPNGAWGAIATMKQVGVNRNIAGRAVELWTSDHGETWRCGPASTNPVDPRFLPVSCRDTEPSPP